MVITFGWMQAVRLPATGRISRGQAWLGDASAEQQHAYDRIRGITARAVSRIRAGLPIADLAAFCGNQLSELDFPITSSISALAARMGHGVGLSFTEPPHLSVEDSTVLEPGMVIAIEPGVATEYGTFHVEENVLVTLTDSSCSRTVHRIYAGLRQAEFAN